MNNHADYEQSYFTYSPEQECEQEAAKAKAAQAKDHQMTRDESNAQLEAQRKAHAAEQRAKEAAEVERVATNQAKIDAAKQTVANATSSGLFDIVSLMTFLPGAYIMLFGVSFLSQIHPSSGVAAATYTKFGVLGFFGALMLIALMLAQGKGGVKEKAARFCSWVYVCLWTVITFFA